jgi:hypothetical protein
MRRLFALALLAPIGLGGCGIQAAIQGAGSQVGPITGQIDDTIYSVAIAKYKSAQMFKAQIDGNIVLPPLPPPTSVPVPTTVPVPTSTPAPPTLTPPATLP